MPLVCPLTLSMLVHHHLNDFHRFYQGRYPLDGLLSSRPAKRFRTPDHFRIQCKGAPMLERLSSQALSRIIIMSYPKLSFDASRYKRVQICAVSILHFTFLPCSLLWSVFGLTPSL
jgi:hypothetical protein